MKWLKEIAAAFAVWALVSPRRAAAEGRPQNRFVPGSAAFIALFERAAILAGINPAWARDPALAEIVRRESGGRVGRPNYQFGDPPESEWPKIWAAIRGETWRTLLAEPYRSRPAGEQSSATGLGQLIRTNVDAYYPSGRAGIGDPVNEAIGTLKYIRDRYGTPAAAYAHGMRTGKWSGY